MNDKLESKLAYLEQFGKPRLSKQDQGWYASIDIFVTGEGISFDIKTEFDHGSPSIAIDELISRTKEALNSVGRYQQITE